MHRIEIDIKTGEKAEIPLTDAEIAEFNASQQPTIPGSVSMRQARLALLECGLLSSVNSAVAQLQEAAQIEWEYATTVVRDSPLVSGLSGALGLTEAQIDSLFLAASEK